MTAASAMVELRMGMTIGEARTAVAAAWPLVRISLFWGSTAYYHDGRFAEDCGNDDATVLRPEGTAYLFRGSPGKEARPFPDPVVRLAGSSTLREWRDAIYGSYGLEPEWDYVYSRLPVSGRTLDEVQANGERYRAAFAARHGREPEIHDRFDDLSI